MIRPPTPVPFTSLAAILFSSRRRRTTGERTRGSLAEPFAVAAFATGTKPGGGGGGVGADATGTGSGAVTTGAGAGGGGGATGGGATATGGVSTTGGAGAGAGAGAGGAPESPITAKRAPTATVSPSFTKISVTTPAAGEGTSESTLSVDTSKSGSSRSTASPIFFIQRVIVPSVTVSPSCGIVTSANVKSPSS